MGLKTQASSLPDKVTFESSTAKLLNSFKVFFITFLAYSIFSISLLWAKVANSFLAMTETGKLLAMKT